MEGVMNVFIDQDLNVVVSNLITNKEVSVTTSDAVSSGEASGEVTGDMSGDMSGDLTGELTGTTIKDPFLSSWPVVIGISSVTLIISVALGILLAKRKIKKGFELYED
jgi:hypothetical protein